MNRSAGVSQRDSARFRRVLIPDLMTATGLGQHYCSLIRLGKRVPHPRHWTALRLVGQGG